MSTSYRRGADFERRVRARLEATGWRVVRAAGSKGDCAVDLIAWRNGAEPTTVATSTNPVPMRRVVALQCKRRGARDFSVAERRAMDDLTAGLTDEVYLVRAAGRKIEIKGIRTWSTAPWEPFESVL